jgi:hypothetical protein
MAQAGKGFPLESHAEGLGHGTFIRYCLTMGHTVLP